MKMLRFQVQTAKHNDDDALERSGVIESGGARTRYFQEIVAMKRIMGTLDSIELYFACEARVVFLLFQR